MAYLNFREDRAVAAPIYQGGKTLQISRPTPKHCLLEGKNGGKDRHGRQQKRRHPLNIIGSAELGLGVGSERQRFILYKKRFLMYKKRFLTFFIQ